MFKRAYDLIGPFILCFLFALIALPLFDYSYWVGFGSLLLLLTGIYFHYQLASKQSLIRINASEKKIVVKNRFGAQGILFDEVDSVYIKSKYNGTFTSADKRTNHDYDIILGIILKNGQQLNLFFYKSDYREPNSEILEVHDYLLGLLSK